MELDLKSIEGSSANLTGGDHDRHGCNWSSHAQQPECQHHHIPFRQGSSSLGPYTGLTLPTILLRHHLGLRQLPRRCRWRWWWRCRLCFVAIHHYLLKLCDFLWNGIYMFCCTRLVDEGATREGFIKGKQSVYFIEHDLLKIYVLFPMCLFYVKMIIVPTKRFFYVFSFWII